MVRTSSSRRLLHVSAGGRRIPGRHGLRPPAGRGAVRLRAWTARADFDCPVPAACPPERIAEPIIDYLSRDFAGLRQLLLDRLSLLIAAHGPTARSPISASPCGAVRLSRRPSRLRAGLRVARRRTWAPRAAGSRSPGTPDCWTTGCTRARRHGPGWPCRPTDVDGITLPAGTEVGTAAGPVFHTLHDLTVRSARSAIAFYTWGDLRCCLPRGATRATLRGTCAELQLHAGDVLVLEEVRGASGKAVDADRTHRWAVRLSEEPVDATDPLTGTEVVEVRLVRRRRAAVPACASGSSPRARCLDPIRGRRRPRQCRAGRARDSWSPLEPVVPDRVPARGRYRPRLGPARARVRGAVPTTRRRSAPGGAGARGRARRRRCRRSCALTDGREDWTVRPDLLGSDRFEPDVRGRDGRRRPGTLRFGDAPGRQPAAGATVRASYRVGGGRAGNVGADVLTELAPPVDGLSVRNPLPARGGTDPEPVGAGAAVGAAGLPGAGAGGHRLPTTRAIAERHPQVQRAAATRRWTGSWYTEYVTVDRLRGAAGRPPLSGPSWRPTSSAYRMAGVRRRGRRADPRAAGHRAHRVRRARAAAVRRSKRALDDRSPRATCRAAVAASSTRTTSPSPSRST